MMSIAIASSAIRPWRQPTSAPFPLALPYPPFGSFLAADVCGVALPAKALVTKHYSGFAPRVRTFGFAGFALFIGMRLQGSIRSVDKGSELC